MIKVSTITPCFKMEKYLKLFLDRLPRQTVFENLEVVLDHNEPTEQELVWVKEFQQKYPGHLKHIVVNPVEPIGNSMNRCIQESSGDFLTIWNVDDLRTDDSIEKQLALLELDSECDIANGSFIITREFGSEHGEIVDHSKYGKDEYLRSMILGPFFMFKKDLLIKSGLFDEQLKSGADFDFAIRLAANSKNIGYSDGILGFYLNEGKGASTNGDGKQPTERTVIELRYGILDKIDLGFVHKAMRNYDIRTLYFNGNKEDVYKYINMTFDDLLKKNWLQK